MKLRLLAALALIFATQTVGAADGEALYQQRICVTCHGPQGKTPIAPNYPRLVGQNKDYLVAQFKDIKSGTRSNALTATMKGVVQQVTDEEIDAIAEYLSNAQ